MRVTFDSNIFQPIVRPDRSTKDAEHPAFLKINAALRQATLRGFIAETMADLETIPRLDRKAYFSGAGSDIAVTENVLPDGRIAIGFVISPSKTAHPGVNDILEERFREAIALGVRFMHCPRIGLPSPAQLDASWFATEIDDDRRGKRQQAFFGALRDIEAEGVGRAVVEKIGSDLVKSARRSMTWFQGLSLAAPGQDKAIIEGIAEWADGDAIAAHIGYENDVFCTRDVGKSAGHSILNASHRTWLNANYGVVFKTPAELAAMI